MMDSITDLKKGKRGAIAKAITIVENDQKEAKKLLKKIFKETGNSIIIGITGPAGAGKSSLINKTAVAMKKLGTNPAVLAVDPKECTIVLFILIYELDTIVVISHI